MNPPLAGRGALSLLIGSIALFGCEKTAAPAAAGSTAASSPEASSTSPTAGMTPHSGDLPASRPTGPAEGATAIGGMSANQDAGGARKGAAAAPTSGDGGAAPSASAAK